MPKDLCVRESYQKDGTEKVSWNKIGVLIDGKEGKQYVKLYHMPGIIVHVFEQKKKEEQKPAESIPGDWDE
jgi:hypothetical protein